LKEERQRRRWTEGCGTIFLAGFAFHFEAPEPRMLSGLKFSRQLALNHIAQKTVKKVMKMNREKFTVLVFP
jgi:hypothetical protein